MKAPTDFQPQINPWSFPVPVKPGNFEGLCKEDQIFNVVTNLSALDSPRSLSKSQKNEFLYSDCQTPYAATALRWGAGRSGFYKNKYLKGVGLTPLAANWNSPDLLHSSGVLPAYSGIFELLISDYLSKNGLKETIVPCETILFAENQKDYVDALITFENLQDTKPASINRKIRAITVKPSNFIRPSNIIWLLSQSILERPIDESYSLPAFFKILYQGCRGDFSYAPDEISIEAICNELENAFKRCLLNFEKFLLIGLDWVNYHNNFSLDGRFIDLETPVLFGKPFCGCITNDQLQRTSFSITYNGGSGYPFAMIQSIVQWQYFIRFLIDRSMSLAKHYQFLNIKYHADVFSYFSKCVEEQFDNGNFLFNPIEIDNWLYGLCEKNCNISAVKKANLKKIISSYINFKFANNSENINLEIKRKNRIHYYSYDNYSICSFADLDWDENLVMSDSAKEFNETMKDFYYIDNIDRLIAKISRMRGR